MEDSWNYIHYIGERDCFLLRTVYRAEVGIVQRLHRLKKGLPPWLSDVAIDKRVQQAAQASGIVLSVSQHQALVTVLQNKVSIMTGGPGVGKTTVIKTLMPILKSKNLRIALSAPTGRATKRLAEATQMHAQTVHRLLGFAPGRRQGQFNKLNPLRGLKFVFLELKNCIKVLIVQRLVYPIK